MAALVPGGAPGNSAGTPELAGGETMWCHVHLGVALEDSEWLLYPEDISRVAKALLSRGGFWIKEIWGIEMGLALGA